MTPPEQFFNFVVGGSSQPETARQHLLTRGNFYGNDAVWVLLPDDGEARAGGDKFLVWRLKAGTLNSEVHPPRPLTRASSPPVAFDVVIGLTHERPGRFGGRSPSKRASS